MDFHYIPETCDVQLLKPINHSAQFLQRSYKNSGLISGDGNKEICDITFWYPTQIETLH
jgi:hypothetical protein